MVPSLQRARRRWCCGRDASHPVCAWFPGGKRYQELLLLLLDEVGDVVPECLEMVPCSGWSNLFGGHKRPDSTIEKLFGNDSGQMYGQCSPFGGSPLVGMDHGSFTNHFACPWSFYILHGSRSHVFLQALIFLANTRKTTYISMHQQNVQNSELQMAISYNHTLTNAETKDISGALAPHHLAKILNIHHSRLKIYCSLNKKLTTFKQLANPSHSAQQKKKHKTQKLSPDWNSFRSYHPPVSG